jgi:hypothetical protein
MFDSWRRTRKQRRNGGLETWRPTPESWMANARRGHEVTAAQFAAATAGSSAEGAVPAAAAAPGATPAASEE